MIITNAPKGTKDILPSESYKWQYIEEKIRGICDLFNCYEVRVPTFEHTELFLRSVGDTTDIVNKEMYTFEDKGGRSITLKPEGTAGVARCFLQNKIYAGTLPQKMYYLNSPTFRYERPQAGRYREHHQFGVEVFGSASPSVEAEIMSIAMTLLSELGLKNLVLNVNSIGCKECRPNYNKALLEYLGDSIDDMCESCKSRYKTNPLRILDCKNEGCKKIVENAPTTIEYLCDNCSAHFDGLKAMLNEMEIPYVINTGIVRGLDYYTGPVFEIITESIGAQGTVCGGGRYNDLIEEIGGAPTPAAGFGLGMERLLLVMENDGADIPKPRQIDIYFAALGEDAQKKALTLASDLRKNGYKVETVHNLKSLKAQMKYANKINTRFTAILGGDELEKGVVTLRSMADSSEEQVVFDEIAGYIGKGE